MNQIESRVTGFVLAGGKSERLGRDKRRIEVSGVTLLARSIGILHDLLGHHPYVVGDNLEGFQIPDEFVIRDAKKDSGPLGGLVASLDRCRTEWALLLAVDLPRITVEDLRKLISSANDSFDVVTLSAGELPEPLIAIYRNDTKSYWLNRLENGQLSLSEGFNFLKCKKIHPAGGMESLRNINIPRDLEFENDGEDS